MACSCGVNTLEDIFLPLTEAMVSCLDHENSSNLPRRRGGFTSAIEFSDVRVECVFPRECELLLPDIIVLKFDRASLGAVSGPGAEAVWDLFDIVIDDGSDVSWYPSLVFWRLRVQQEDHFVERRMGQRARKHHRQFPPAGRFCVSMCAVVQRTLDEKIYTTYCR